MDEQSGTPVAVERGTGPASDTTTNSQTHRLQTEIGESRRHGVPTTLYEGPVPLEADAASGKASACTRARASDHWWLRRKAA
jgi:hypothetical protein